MMTSDVFKFRFINGEWTGQQTAHAITLGGPYGTTTFKYTIWSNQKKKEELLVIGHLITSILYFGTSAYIYFFRLFT